MSFTELILEHSQGWAETQVEKFKAELFSEKNIFHNREECC